MPNFAITRGYIACLFFALTCSSAVAQQYPTKPVRLIVPFAAGGSFDRVGRIVALQLTELLHQQVVVDNRPGGGTIIATEIVAKSNPDGYTLLLASNALAANPALHEKLPYNGRDLSTVALIAYQPMGLAAHPNFPPNSVKDLINLARSKPDQLSYGTAGIGSGGWLAGELFKAAASIQLLHVGYKGGNLAMLDLMANRIPLVVTGLPNLLPQIKAGKLKVLAITDKKRSQVAPDIPTIAETVSGYEYTNWFGIVVPAATPRKITHLLNSQFNKAIETPGIRQQLLASGYEVLGGSEEEFSRVLKSDTAKFAKLIREASLRTY
ncbi:MAG: tripartite tricarboxylate transporter substrate binding protein [Burkholderiales bacterium]|nr:tripartite tricarboxylate transporter substrate binding protein [Burkholderiales bacterium]